MLAWQAKERYPAFLLCLKNGIYTPWPGPSCVNQSLQPVSAWSDAGCPPQPILNRCVAAEMAAAAT